MRSFLKETERGVELGVYLPGWGGVRAWVLGILDPKNLGSKELDLETCLGPKMFGLGHYKNFEFVK